MSTTQSNVIPFKVIEGGRQLSAGAVTGGDLFFILKILNIGGDLSVETAKDEIKKLIGIHTA